MDQASTLSTPTPPLRILSLDGGGIRGISSLLILEDIMEKIREAQGLAYVPRPCEQFDLIGGTSTGGIIAIMLGRLGMTVDECIKAYRRVAQKAFTPKRPSLIPARPTGAYSAEALEAAVKQVVKEHCVEARCVARRTQGLSTVYTCPHGEMGFRDISCTKTIVLAITKDNVDARPTLFKTYDSSTSFRDCTIWQVARATSAATTFFSSIKLGRDEIEFADAGFGYNNPCEVLIEEAQQQFPTRQQMRILSLGTGLGDVVAIKDTRFSIINALKMMATTSKRAAARLDNKYGESAQYYRFNVDQGLNDITLSDWKEASKISAHTHNYLCGHQRKIRNFVDYFTNAMSSDEKSSQSTNSTTLEQHAHADKAREQVINESPAQRHWIVPFGRNADFVGRESILNQLLKRIPPNMVKDDCQRTAIEGLGGIGKTQIALEASFRIRDEYQDCSVFWVPAIDAFTFENAYREIGQRLNIDKINEDKADVKLLVKNALSHENTGNWLLVIDNADDEELLFGNSKTAPLSDYLPFSLKGSILLTTRNHETIVRLDIPVRNIITTEEMTRAEAIKLLQRNLKDYQMRDMESTTSLLDFLANLPLAIRQAAAYMAKTGTSTTKYLYYCQSSNANLLKLLSMDFEDRGRYKSSRNPITATWLVSFDHIARNNQLAAYYLQFMCFLAEKNIPLSLLPAENDELEANEAIGMLKAYAFITEREESHSFDIHRLVRQAMQNWVKEKENREKYITEIIQYLSDKFPFPKHENRDVWVNYLPHAQAILEFGEYSTDDKAEWSLLFSISTSQLILGKFQEAEQLCQKTLKLSEKVLGTEHPDTLASMDNLASALYYQGKYEDAKQLHQQTLTVSEKVLGTEHSDTLRSMNGLANALYSQGKYEDAEQLYRQTIKLREKILGAEHPDTLASMKSLADMLDIPKAELA